MTRAPSNRATVVSDDGTVAAGFAENGPLDRTPAMWRADGTGELLDPTQTDTPGEVLSISADGRTLAGISGYDGFVWTRGTGLVRMVRFDLALPSDPVYPNAMTADGSIIYRAVGDAFFSYHRLRVRATGGVPSAAARAWPSPRGCSSTTSSPPAPTARCSSGRRRMLGREQELRPAAAVRGAIRATWPGLRFETER